MKTLYIKTYGCQINEYDSNRIFDLLQKTHGIQKAHSSKNADIVLLNTCTIRKKAQEKIFSQLGRWRLLKQQRPHLIIGVAGCVASQEGKAIQRRAPYVDLIIGPQTIHRLPTILDKFKRTRRPQIDISFPELEKFDNLPVHKAQGPSASVSIMEGCNKYCSFCIVPYTRGEEISRPFDDVIAEVVSLSEQSVKEIVLLGQNVNAYRGLQHDGKIADLALLITYVAEIKGVERIRFSTSHPLEFSNNLVHAYQEVPKLANHLHLPVQSGSDKILTNMKRGHTTSEYKTKIHQLRNVRPDISISSDFIVGFPGETETDFEATMKLIKEIQFDQSFSFIYSQRPGTPAANYPDDIPLAIKKTRLQRLQKQLSTQARTNAERMLLSKQAILVTGASKKDPKTLCGRTENNRIVNFKGLNNLIGQIITVQITEILQNSLRGKLQ